MNAQGNAGAFARALLDPTARVPDGLVSWNGSDTAQRFGIYRNNVVVALIEALGAKYPAVRAELGEQFFRAIARVYLGAHPPASPLLVEYGVEFPAFLAFIEPAASLPHLADLARLEAAWLVAYHAADAPAIGAADLAALDAGTLAEIRVALHPAARLIRSRYAIGSLWSARDMPGAPEIRDRAIGEDVLVTRPKLEVRVTRVAPAVAAAIAALAAGANLGDAVLSARGIDDDFDAAQLFGTMITTGFAGAINPGGAHPRRMAAPA